MSFDGEQEFPSVPKKVPQKGPLAPMSHKETLQPEEVPDESQETPLASPLLQGCCLVLKVGQSHCRGDM